MEAFYCAYPDGRRVYAELYLPESGKANWPLLILGHGFAGSASYLKGYAAYMAQCGIACCIFDFCGGSHYSRSDGTMLDMSLLTECDDLRLLFAALRRRRDIDPRRIYLGGESQGGLVAALTAPEVQAEIAGLILLYPALYIPEAMRRQFPNRAVIPDRVEELGSTVGRRYVEDAYPIDAYREIGRYRGRVLILHGDRDRLVPLRYSQRAAEVYQDARLVILPGAGHGVYSGVALRLACREIVQFIRRPNLAG